MKILGIDGSPRKNGNTEKLVKTILQGAEANGAETRHYKVARMNISPCPGCMDCRQSDICIHEDDMTPLYDEVQFSGAIVAAGTRQENDILQQADVLEKAREIGMSMTA